MHKLKGKTYEEIHGKKKAKILKELRRKRFSGENSPFWKGGKIINNGYVRVKCPDHPYCNNQRYVREHRLVMEAHIGRYLLPTEIVHHINGNKKDNRIENLMIYSDNEHKKYHEKLKKEKRIWK